MAVVADYISRLIPRRTLGSDEPMKTLVIRNVKEDNRNSTFAELKSAITEMGIEEFFQDKQVDNGY